MSASLFLWQDDKWDVVDEPDGWRLERGTITAEIYLLNKESVYNILTLSFTGIHSLVGLL